MYNKESNSFQNLNFYVSFLFADDPKECKIADCTLDIAVELCPKTCSESKICKVADCKKSESLQTCPRTCAVSTKDDVIGKDIEEKTTRTENEKGMI